LLDEELMEMLKEELETPSDSPCLGGELGAPLNRGDGGATPVVFISAVTGFGLDELKDVLWAEMNAESNKLAAITTTESIAHRDKDMTRFQAEMADEGEDEEIEFVDAEDIEELDDFEYEEEA
jgi:GTP-binding protein